MSSQLADRRFADEALPHLGQRRAAATAMTRNPVDTAVGVVLMIAPHEMFPPFLHTGRAWGPSPLADLHAGGIIMWVGSDLVMAVLAAGLAVLLVHGTSQAGPGRAGDEDVRLAAYNAYLATLSGCDPP
jgi:cytochrome c oxidase assembly factor CtaG